MHRNALNQYLTEYLQPERFSDYCPNGLQVEGRQEIRKIVSGVTACQALLEQALLADADAILVHHGYFWKGEKPAVTGIKKHRLQLLLQHDINLFAYHLPLDAHVEVGNNVMLGKLLGLEVEEWLDYQQIVAKSTLKQPILLDDFSAQISKLLMRQVQLIGDGARRIKTVAWCTGSAQGYIEQAIANDVDVFISGEISEPTVHMARESNTAYISAGHHATERYGVQALGEHLANKFDLSHEFIDIDNPV